MTACQGVTTATPCLMVGPTLDSHPTSTSPAPTEAGAGLQPEAHGGPGACDTERDHLLTLPPLGSKIIFSNNHEMK